MIKPRFILKLFPYAKPLHTKGKLEEVGRSWKKLTASNQKHMNYVHLQKNGILRFIEKVKCGSPCS